MGRERIFSKVSLGVPTRQRDVQIIPLTAKRVGKKDIDGLFLKLREEGIK
jgi:hypothetical protein